MRYFYKIISFVTVASRVELSNTVPQSPSRLTSRPVKREVSREITRRELRDAARLHRHRPSEPPDHVRVVVSKYRAPHGQRVAAGAHCQPARVHRKIILEQRVSDGHRRLKVPSVYRHAPTAV